MNMKKITLFGLMFYVCNIFAQIPATIPYVNNFDLPADTLGWKMENIDTLGEWAYSSDFFGINQSGSFVFMPDNVNLSNNWVISVPIQLTGGITYSLDFKYENLSMQTVAPSNLSVYFGTQQDSSAMTTQIVNVANYVNNTDFADSHSTFSVPTSGVYYIGFHEKGSNGGGNYDGGGTFDNLSNGNISIFPNPASEWLNIVLPQSNAKVMIYNVAGQLVLEEEMTSSAAKINISGLSKGIYLVKMYAGNEIYTNKISKY
jgi:hypothetical protein